MIANKHVTALVAILTTIALLLSISVVIFQDRLRELVGDGGITMDYEKELFDTSEIMTVNILMDQDEWDTMLESATAEEYYECDVEINGETYYHVGIRPKGNTSLTSIASDPDTDRFSLKIEFDHFVEGQTCHGLDKLILNNNYADATNMKEALIYDMYQYMDADASLYNYASISVNGTYWGVYLALEAVEDSFMLRNYGTRNGDLYKPDSLNIGGVDGAEFDADDMDFSSFSFDGMDFGNFSFDGTDTGSFSFDGKDTGGFSFDGKDTGGIDFSNIGGFGGFSMSGSGANLNYTDDDLDSYSTIWEGAVTDSGKTDHKRVVKALKNISEGTDLEENMDVDNILRYMAVHVFSVNDDSLTGAMAHNYYLYESDGQLNMIPWDYNLSFGGMGSSNDASDVINDAIDDAFTGTNFFDTLMEDEDYHNQYYAYLEQLVDEYINGGGFDAFYERTRAQIDTLVEQDPTAFYTYEEYLTAVEELYNVVKLRGESVSRQIDGTIASYASARSDADALVDASGIDLSVLGSMNTGNGGGNSFGGMTFPATPGDSTTQTGDWPEGTEASQESDESMPEGAMPDGFDTSQIPSGTMPDGFDTSQIPSGTMPDGFDMSQMSGAAEESTDETSEQGETAAADESQAVTMPSFSGSGSFTMPGAAQGVNSTTILYYGISAAVLLIGFVIVLLYRRRRH